MTDDEIERIYRKAAGIVQARQVADKEKADIIQQVMILVWRKSGTFQGKSKWETWAERVIQNCVTSCLRALPPPMMDIDMLPMALHPRTYQDHSELEYMDIIKALPMHYQQVLFLYHFHSLRMRDVAEMLGCSYASAWKRHARAQRKLRDSYGKG